MSSNDLRSPASSDHSDRLLAIATGSKRRQVAAACQRCRQRKTKCDGNRPCQFCSRRGLECVFVTEENETRQHAAKRRYYELTQTRDTNSTLLSILTGPEEAVAVEAFRRMRTGEDFESIVQSILPGRPAGTAAPSSADYERLSDLLLRSTAALDEVLDVLKAISNNTLHFRFFDQDASYTRDVIVKPTYLRQILGPISALPRAIRHPNPQMSLTSSHERPLHWAPASPWTRLTDDDEAVSHLVSTFLALINPFWRIVEEDLFLRDLHARRTDAIYCSEALVNAILAFASLYTEIDVAFTTRGDLLTRGEHFHEEALRLWTLEDDRPSVVNMQALIVLGMESSLRGQDRLGWSLISKAYLLNGRLPVPEMKNDMTDTMKDYVSARRCVAAASSWTHASFVLGLMLSPSQYSSAPTGGIVLNHSFPNTASQWTAYPFLTKTVPLQLNLLLQERGKLTGFIREVSQIFFSDKTRTGSDEWLEQVSDLAARYESWIAAMPAGLSYEAEAPYALHEFHAQCRCIRLTIYDRWDHGLTARGDGDANDPSARVSAWRKAQWIACDMAASLRDFREAYGFKSVPPYITHQTALATFLFLRHLQDQSQAQQSAPRFIAVNDRAPGPDTETALEECLRCLVACGLQQFIARGMARMVYHTAAQLKVKLPDTVEEMQKIIGDAMWSASDLQHIKSAYPNLALAPQLGTETIDIGMDVLLRKFESQNVHRPQD